MISDLAPSKNNNPPKRENNAFYRLTHNVIGATTHLPETSRTEPKGPNQMPTITCIAYGTRDAMVAEFSAPVDPQSEVFLGPFMVMIIADCDVDPEDYATLEEAKAAAIVEAAFYNVPTQRA